MITVRCLPLILLGLFLSPAPELSGQRIDYVPGELLIVLDARTDLDKWEAIHPAYESVTPVNASLGVYLLTFDHDRFRSDELLSNLWAEPSTRLVQRNHPVTGRRAPNDLHYDEQWYLRNTGANSGGRAGADYRIESAWDETIGGVTTNDDTIVIAIVDNGFDIDHEDLRDNLWRNPGEVAGNGIDDDNNGYVDDIHGINSDDDNGDLDISPNGHGTPVAGIIGARGDNGIGIAGINWRTQLMLLGRRGFPANERDVIEDYGYILDQRRAYDRTGGELGAYVVATNSSFGLDKRQPEESPIWCALYDSLGNHGILNAGAAANLNIDVEIEGDIPTRCGSDFLIGVTNIDARESLASDAAFGANSIDLAGYGQYVLSTMEDDGYGTVRGTSYATPAVTGAIGLLYAADCAAFAELAQADPRAAALLVRNVILSTARPLASLRNRTVTGGVLNIGAAMDEVLGRCDDCLTASSLTLAPASAPGELSVSWNVIASVTSQQLRFRPAGTTAWTTVDDAVSPVLFTDLADCVRYDFQVLTVCEAGTAPIASDIVSGETDGCCRVPDELVLTNGFRNGLPTILANWSDRRPAGSYQVRHRIVGQPDWITSRRLRSEAFLINLNACTVYEFEVQAACSDTASAFGNRQEILTLGCGACTDLIYCIPENQNNAAEWIDSVDIGGLIVNVSKRDVGGYRFFDGIGRADFVPGGVYPVSLQPGYADARLAQDFRIWADWNQDGRFANPEEMAFAGGTGPGGTAATGEFVVPEDATLGSVRLRVFMEFGNNRNAPCTDVAKEGADVEDYCLELRQVNGCPPPYTLTASYDEAADVTTVRWSASAAPGGDYAFRYRLAGAMEWTTEVVNATAIELSDLNLCGAYEAEIASSCGGESGDFRRFTFNDLCVGNRPPALPPPDWNLYPNPATGPVTIDYRLEVFTAAGRRLRQLAPPLRLPPGLYFVVLTETGGARGVRKLVIH